MASKQFTEAWHFEMFRHHVDDLPIGDVIHVETDPSKHPDGAPDFLVRAVTNCVGIELTRLYKPTNPDMPIQQAIEADIDEVIRLAQSEYQSGTAPPLHVSLFFTRQREIDRSKRLEIATDLVTIVCNNVPEPGCRIILEERDCELRSIIDFIDRIHIDRNQYQRRHHWHSVQAAWVWKDCIDAIQQAISRKALKLPTYLTHCDECWLLVVADSLRPSGAIYLDDVSRQYLYESPFARTYFVDTGLGRVDRLSTRNVDSG